MLEADPSDSRDSGVTPRASRARGLRRLDVELNALRERQRAAIVHGVGGPAHVGLPAVGAGFAAAAGLLFAAERPADLGARGTDIDVGDAAIGAPGRGEE